MGLYRINDNALKSIAPVSFEQEAVRERRELQQWLRHLIEIIAPGCMVLSEEFNDWEDSNRRIDLLCLDQDACLVVIELERTASGGHMDLQAIRYAAMVSNMTFDRAVRAHAIYLSENNLDPTQAEQRILDFLNWPQPDEDEFANEVKIILGSADFSSEVTSSAIWLGKQGIDVRCVQLALHKYRDELIVNVSQIIPIPSAEEYQVKEREKISERKAARRNDRSETGFAFVNVGEHSGPDNHRSWGDCRKYGFISAGGKSIEQLDRLQIGKPVLAYLKGHGYVGVGTVITPPTAITDLIVESEGKSLDQLPIQHRDNPKTQAEMFIGIRWIRSLDRADAIKAAPYRSTACRVHDRDLVETVLSAMGTSIEDCSDQAQL